MTEQSETAMPYVPSPQQAAFYTWVQTGTGNAILRAVAGAGKTTTLLRGSALCAGNTLFLVYGRQARLDIVAKAEEGGFMRPDLRISTVHSTCFKAWMRAAPGVQLDADKVPNLLTDLATRDPAAAAVLEVARGPVAKLIGLGKAFLMGVPDLTNPQVTRQRSVLNVAVWNKLAERYSLFDDLPEEYDTGKVIDLVIRAFELSAASCRTVIDHDDQIYAPLRFRARFFKQDWIFGDEWQDANPARREAVRRMMHAGTRCVFVGDECQDIFGFTGTGNDSLGRTADEFKCTRLDLTVTYRCPKAVVAYAQQWVSHIQAHENAPKGVVRTYAAPAGADPKAMWYAHCRPQPTDAILCRYNKPLVETAFGLIREGIACKVEGRDIGKGLIALAQRWKVKSLEALETKLAGHVEKAAAKAKETGNDRKLQSVEDQVETLKVFIERCRAKGQHTLDCLVAEVLNLFEDGVEGVTTLASGHKCKGREWGRVYWLEAALRTRRPLQAWEAEQERNINYVIATRVEGQHGAGELILVPESVHSPLKPRTGGL